MNSKLGKYRVQNSHPPLSPSYLPSSYHYHFYFDPPCFTPPPLFHPPRFITILSNSYQAIASPLATLYHRSFSLTLSIEFILLHRSMQAYIGAYVCTLHSHNTQTCIILPRASAVDLATALLEFRRETLFCHCTGCCVLSSKSRNMLIKCHCDVKIEKNVRACVCACLCKGTFFIKYKYIACVYYVRVSTWACIRVIFSSCFQSKIRFDSIRYLIRIYSLENLLELW